MAMSQRSGIGGRGGFTGYRRPQRQLPQPRPFRPPAPTPPPPPPPPPSVKTFEPRRETEEPNHHSFFLLRLHLPGFTKLEEVKIAKATDTESEHIVRIQGDRLDLQSNSHLRFDTKVSVPPEFDISPPIDAKLDAGVLTLTFPKFSSSSCSSSDSESESEFSSSTDDDDHKSPQSGVINPNPNAIGKASEIKEKNMREADEHKKPEVKLGGGGGDQIGKEATAPLIVRDKEAAELARKNEVEEGKERLRNEKEIGREVRAATTAAVGKSELVVNMGAAVAVIAALGTYTYYFMFP
ncbi:hypothetical protein LINGRAHAP2_LOCUS2616 [Linum grandiflorum]